jgi:hypothetical protein
MAITLELDVYLAEKVLRDDILQNLSYDGVERIIEYYDELGEDISFDQSLFWCFHRYENAIEALRDYNDSIISEIIDKLKEDDPDEEPSEDDIEEKCLEYLENSTTCFEMNDGTVIVNTEY